MYVTDPTDTIQVFMFDREVRRLVSATVNGLIGQNMKVKTHYNLFKNKVCNTNILS